MLLQAIEGLPPNEQRLLYSIYRLEDGRTLADYPISEGSTLQVVARLKYAFFLSSPALAARWSTTFHTIKLPERQCALRNGD